MQLRPTDQQVSYPTSLRASLRTSQPANRPTFSLSRLELHSPLGSPLTRPSGHSSSSSADECLVVLYLFKRLSGSDCPFVWAAPICVEFAAVRAGPSASAQRAARARAGASGIVTLARSRQPLRARLPAAGPPKCHRRRSRRLVSLIALGERTEFNADTQTNELGQPAGPNLMGFVKTFEAARRSRRPRICACCR